MDRQHTYNTTIKWTGNRGIGTAGYTKYDRDHTIIIDGKKEILASSDPAFRGNPERYNPEDLLLASVSSCHMLWYLHLCAEAGVIVVDYEDNATGLMIENPVYGGKFEEITLHPIVTITSEEKADIAMKLHKRANELCFISNSVNFPVHHEVLIKVKSEIGI